MSNHDATPYFYDPLLGNTMNKSNKIAGTSALLIEKSSLSKRGTVIGSDLYLRCSIQDYFIKFCESEITKSDLLPFVNQGITVEMETRFGELDRCPDDPQEVQSRIGTYAVIHKILATP